MSVLRTQLMSIAASARAQAATAEAILAALGSDEPPVRVDGSRSPTPGDACAHPASARIDAATMGHETAWVCGVCGYPGEGRGEL